jgi:hypothetical protein
VVTGQAGQAPGVVKARLSGDPADIEVVAEILSGYPGAGVEVIEHSPPYVNRRDPGVRVYLTLRISEPEGGRS